MWGSPSLFLGARHPARIQQLSAHRCPLVVRRKGSFPQNSTTVETTSLKPWKRRKMSLFHSSLWFRDLSSCAFVSLLCFNFFLVNNPETFQNTSEALFHTKNHMYLSENGGMKAIEIHTKHARICTYTYTYLE